MTRGHPARQGEPRRGEEPRAAQAPRGRRLLLAIYVVGLFALFYAYVLVRIGPEVFYHQDPRVFLFDAYYVAGFLDRPGGPVDYASAFLSPLMTFGWLGALVITLLAALVCLATRHFIAALEGEGGKVLFLIPAVLILTLLGQYIHPVRLCVGLLVALVLAGVYSRTAGRHFMLRLAAFAVTSALVYYLIGALYVVFACLCALFELGRNRNPALAASYLLCAAVIPFFAGTWMFGLNVRQAYGELMLDTDGIWLAMPSSVPFGTTIRSLLVAFFPTLAVVLAWRRYAAGRPRVESETPPEVQTGPGGTCTPGPRVSWRGLAVRAAALGALALAADWVASDFPKKCLLEMDWAVEQERWDDVLAYAERLPPSDPRVLDPRVMAEVNRALYFRGELLDRMFAYPQASKVPSLAFVYQSATMMAQWTPRQASDVLFDLGRVNESQHMAYEALEIFGKRPEILKRLVYLHVLKGEPEAARRFLAVLERSLLYRRWARDCRRRLDADPALSDVPAVASRRELMVSRDAIDAVHRLETMLLSLLDRNPRNRMAIEYLLAHYLLTRQLDKLAANVHRLGDLGDTPLPRHCEEGLAVHFATGGLQGREHLVRRIGPDTWERLEQFVRIEQQWRGETSAAFAALEPEFRDTYFLYCVFAINRPPTEPSEPSR